MYIYSRWYTYTHTSTHLILGRLGHFSKSDQHGAAWRRINIQVPRQCLAHSARARKWRHSIRVFHTVSMCMCVRVCGAYVYKNTLEDIL